MKYNRTQFTDDYYRLWQLGLLLPTPSNASVYSVKYRKNQFDEYSRVTLKATSVTDALERACYANTYSSPWKPEDIDLHAVYDAEENLLWIDEPYYNIVQKKHEFRGMERREFMARFGATAAAILFGVRSFNSVANATTVSLSGSASNFCTTTGGTHVSGIPGSSLYTTAGTYNWCAPLRVTSVSVVCVGGGSSGSSGNGGGGLGWKNNITVIPGQGYVVVVGGAGNSPSTPSSGEHSSFINSTTVCGYGGNLSTGGSFVGDGGGAGGSAAGLGGGGAGGYSGAGGFRPSGGTDPGGGGSGGAGGAGGYWGPGGGVGLNGVGASGSTVCCHSISGSPGSGGSGVQYGAGGAYSGIGGSGAVRIIWGAGRSFPSNAA